MTGEFVFVTLHGRNCAEGRRMPGGCRAVPPPSFVRLSALGVLAWQLSNLHMGCAEEGWSNLQAEGNGRHSARAKLRPRCRCGRLPQYRAPPSYRYEVPRYGCRANP